MTNEEFEAVVKKTIAKLPQEFREQLDNVEVVVETKESNPSLLGLYRGVPKTERYSYFALPDKITIYKRTIEAIAQTPDEIRAQIRQTVLHEIGHYFGLSDEELDRRSKN